MYKNSESHQISLFDFNQSFGTPLDAQNEWVIYASEIDWKAMESQYASLFSSRRGRPAASFRMVLGALIIQQRLNLSDRALVKALTEDPYLQYFIGIDRYEHRPPFHASSLTAFRRRFGREYLQEINRMLPEGLSVPIPVKVGLIFTTHGDLLVHEVERCVRAEFGDTVEIMSLGDASILDETVAAGAVTPQAASRLVRMYLDAVDAGCDAILNVCSSVGEVADSMRDFSRILDIPIVRIDEEMCRRAVCGWQGHAAASTPRSSRRGSLPAPENPEEDRRSLRRIAVMATLPSTLTPTRRLLERCAAEEGCCIELTDVLVDNAFGLDPEALGARLIEAAKTAASQCDAFVLAQGSMSLCEDPIHQATGKPVYSSPRSGAYALKQTLECMRRC